MANIKVTISEKPQTVRVEHKGEVHTARWHADGGTSDVEGDIYIIKAVMCAWDGPNEFVISEGDLEKRSGGWWKGDKCQKK